MIKLTDGREYEWMDEWMNVMLWKYHLIKNKNILDKSVDFYKL